MKDRELEVVLFGATGYTGRLVAEHLAAAADPPRWAIAGRDRARLEALGAELVAAGGSQPAIVVADQDDAASLAAMAARSQVVASTVGPYARRGEALVAACIAAGTHYADLTGEVPWMRRMIDAHHDEARARHVRITHACGFDSVPSDLGLLELQTLARARFGRPCERVTAYYEVHGGVSGGTVATMLNTAEAAVADADTRRMLTDPYALVPDPALRGPDRGEQRGVGHSRVLDRTTAPFIMAGVNARVVRRSHALLGRPWGPEFRYDECMTLPAGPRGKLIGAAVSYGMPLALGALAVPSLRRMIEPRLPQPGQGPTPAARARGRFVVRLVGECDGDPRIFARVADDREPGYDSTAVMLGEAARCLAEDALLSPGGVTTPAVAMGHHLAERLRAAGFTIEAGSDRALLA